jgi:hypothetical protein
MLGFIILSALAPDKLFLFLFLKHFFLYLLNHSFDFCLFMLFWILDLCCFIVYDHSREHLLKGKAQYS